MESRLPRFPEVKPQSAIFLLGVFCVASSRGEEIPLTNPSRLEMRNAQPESTTYHGLAALKLTERDSRSGTAFALLKDFQFHDGTIEVDLAGTLSKTAPDQARGFIGVAFHIQPGGSRFENIYIRPTNGRASDQLRRNHSAQYVSEPDWPWERLRKESPGVYESYVDLAAGEWTHCRIVVKGREASLYIGNASQPCLLIHDLKLGDTRGEVALWIGPGTEGYFRNLKISSGSEPEP
jgi:hypothetical protein